MTRAQPLLLSLAVAAASLSSTARVAPAQELLVVDAAPPLLIDDRAPARPMAPGGPVDVTQQLPADLPPSKPIGPTGPLGDEIAGLIKQLGADDFRARDAAAKRLREVGNDALGPLAEAKANPDPEVASRAAGIIRQITK